MSIPFHLSSASVPYNFLEVSAGIVDVETGGVGIITTFRAQAVTGLGWAEPSAALFKTPVDAAGRFMDVLLTRISASTLEMRVRNQSSLSICVRRIIIDTAAPGSPVRYFFNVYGFYLEATRAASLPENLQAHVLDMTPDAFTDHTNYTAGMGYRDSAGADDGNGKIAGILMMLDNGSATIRSRLRKYDYDMSNIAMTIMGATGNIPTMDAWLDANFAGTLRWAGRVCHCIVVDTQNAPGNVIRPNIDGSTQASFKVVYQNPQNAMRVAFRTA